MAELLSDISGLIEGERNTITLQDDVQGLSSNTLAIDATVREEITYESKLTEHEIEDGSVINDHVINKPRKLMIEGIISDDPLSLPGSAITTAAGGLFGNLVGDTVGAVATGVVAKVGNAFVNGGTPPSLTAYHFLKTAREQKIPMTIFVGLDYFPSMIMEKLSIPRDSKNARALEFKASFKQIRVVSSEITFQSLENLAEDAQGASKEKNKGSQLINEVSGQVTDKVDSSLMNNFLELF